MIAPPKSSVWLKVVVMIYGYLERAVRYRTGGCRLYTKAEEHMRGRGIDMSRSRVLGIVGSYVTSTADSISPLGQSRHHIRVPSLLLKSIIS